jgi:predicted outer membrane repeat protein
MNKFSTFLLLVLLVQVLPAQAQFYSYTVDNTLDLDDANPHDFQCIASNGSCTLRAAIDQLNYNDGIVSTIDFQAPGMEFTIDSPLTISTDIEISGYGIDFITINSSSATSLFIYESLTISDLTITGGYIYVNIDASLTMEDVKVTGSTRSSAGGAIAFYGSQLHLTRCQLTDNQVTYEGGAIYAVGYGGFPASVTLIDCDLMNNQAGEEGGGLYTEVDTLIEDSWFESNTATTDGGGIYIGGNSTTVDIVRTNISASQAANGGGLLIDTTGSTVKIRESSIITNSAGTDGGGLLSRGSEVLHLTNTTVSTNSAANHGGGLCFDNDFTTATINSCTIAKNTADSDGDGGNGGGFYNSNTFGIVEIRDSLLAANNDSTSDPLALYAPDCEGRLTSYGYNLIGYANSLCDLQGDSSGNQVGNPNDGVIDPLLGILIRPLYLPTFSHGLANGSPAIDGADPTGSTDWDGTLLLSDQVGNLRPLSLNCDIGAIERNDVSYIFAEGFESGDVSRWSSTVP